MTYKDSANSVSFGRRCFHIKQRLKENHLFRKIFSYFLLLLIPTLVIGIAAYCFSVYTVQKNFNEQIALNLNSAIGRVTMKMYSVCSFPLPFKHRTIG